MPMESGRPPLRGSGHSPSGLSQSSLSQAQPSVPNAGDTFTIAYPFVRDTFLDVLGEFEDGYPVERPTWKPGTRSEDIGPEDAAEFADAIGSATFTVIGAYRPGRFPTRVFFTRQFTDPDGKAFGKGKLHIKTLGQFRRLTSGYLEPFGIGDTPPPQRWSSRQSREIFEKLLAEHCAPAMTAALAKDRLSALPGSEK
jgi:hypothetical protein